MSRTRAALAVLAAMSLVVAGSAQAVTTKTRRISLRSNGAQAQGCYSYVWSRSISATGRFVAFESAATNLVSNDTNGVYDVFVRDRVTGKTRRVSVRSNGA